MMLAQWTTSAATESIIGCTVPDAGSSSRRYTLRRRAESQEATRLRIVEAAVSLHRSEGPARTSISAIAELAGVQRHTVYRHFPQETALFRACAAHFLAGHPPPNPTDWAQIEDPGERLRRGLGELYSYYEANHQMIANVLRDSAVVAVGAGFRSLHAAASDALRSSHPSGRQSPAFAIAVRLATDFRAWQAFGPPGTVTPAEAADLMCRMLACL